jgi:hypothetical protein
MSISNSSCSLHTVDYPLAGWQQSPNSSWQQQQQQPHWQLQWQLPFLNQSTPQQQQQQQLCQPEELLQPIAAAETAGDLIGSISAYLDAALASNMTHADINALYDSSSSGSSLESALMSALDGAAATYPAAASADPFAAAAGSAVDDLAVSCTAQSSAGCFAATAAAGCSRRSIAAKAAGALIIIYCHHNMARACIQKLRQALISVMTQPG